MFQYGVKKAHAVLEFLLSDRLWRGTLADCRDLCRRVCGRRSPQLIKAGMEGRRYAGRTHTDGTGASALRTRCRQEVQGLCTRPSHTVRGLQRTMHRVCAHSAFCGVCLPLTESPLQQPATCRQSCHAPMGPGHCCHSSGNREAGLSAGFC